MKELNMGKVLKKLGLSLMKTNLSMNKPIKLHLLIIIIRCVFSEGGKFYPQVFLDDALYELM